MRFVAPFLALAALAVGAVGCHPFDRVDFDAVTTPPVAASVTFDEVTIPKGIAIAVEARPMSGDDELDAELELRSADTSILGVDPGVDDKTFVLYGVSVGSTVVEVYYDGELEDEIPAQVPLQDVAP
jgi:hypothetical protein